MSAILCSVFLQNSGNRLHGGAITSLVDIVGSAAIFATGAKYSGVSVEINVTFMAAAPFDVSKSYFACLVLCCLRSTPP